MKNFIIKSLLLPLMALLATIFVGDCFGMYMTTKQKKTFAAKINMDRKRQYKPGKYFVYQKNTSKGVLVDQEYLENTSAMVKDMVADLGVGKPQEIMLPFSVDAIKLVFGQKMNNQVSFDQLKDAINCADYLAMKYSENYLPSQAFVKASVYWVNIIGDKLIDLGIEMRDRSTDKGRSIAEIEKDLPDYSIFKKINDPFLTKTIISQLLLSKDNVLTEYTKFRVGPGSTVDRDTISQIFNLEGSISDLLDVIYRYFKFQTIQQRNNEKWFYQRWLSW